MKIISLEEFKESCNKKRCLRNTTYFEKTCSKDYKQDNCYKKYLIKIEKQHQKVVDNRNKSFNKEINIDYEYEEFKRLVWIRDTGSYDGISHKSNWQKYCVIWNYILTEEEKKHILKNYYNDLFVNKDLDIMHIDSVGRKPEEGLNKDNVILAGRLFHNLIDQYKNPVTQKNINNEEREQWLDRLRNYIKEIDKYENNFKET